MLSIRARGDRGPQHRPDQRKGTDSQMSRARIVPAVAGAAIVTLALAACGGGASGFDAAVSGVVNPSTQTGGTLKFVESDDWDSPDPGNTYYAFSWDFAR